MNSPLISITTVCLNSETTIRNTIESVLNQTYTNFEYVLVDGNSSDDTVNIINSYRTDFDKKGINYKLISEPDAGIYHAMNKAVLHSNGKLIGVVGSDDWYELNALEMVANHYDQTNADYIHGNINVYSFKNVFIKTRKAGSENEMIKEMSFFHPASFIKKKIIDHLGGYSLTYDICSDYDLILRIISKKYTISHLNKVICNVRYGGISTSQVNKALRESHRIRVENGYNAFLSKWFYYKALIQYKLKTSLSVK